MIIEEILIRLDFIFNLCYNNSCEKCKKDRGIDMKILVIDGQGGGIGKVLIEQIKDRITNTDIIAVGTNTIATTNMLKAGATAGATGENAVIYNCQTADVIVGPVGIGFANSMYGEISPAIANAICSSNAKRIFIPMTKCSTTIVGITEKPLIQYITDAVNCIAQINNKIL